MSRFQRHRMRGVVLTVLVALLTHVDLHAGQPKVGVVKEKPAAEAAPPAQVQIVTIGITALENRNPLLESDWFSSAAVDLLTAQLSRNAALSVPERSAVEELSREAALGSSAAGLKGVATDFVLGGSYSVENDQLRMELNLSDRAGSRIWGDSFIGPQSTYSQLCRQAARAVMLALDKGNAAPELDADAPAPLAAMVSLYRGKRALERGDAPHALADFLLAAKVAPNYAEAWRQLGETLETLGYRAAAVKAYEHAVDVNGNQPYAARTLWELGLLAEDLPDPAVARGIYGRIRKEFPFAISKIPNSNGTGLRSYASLAAARLDRLDKLAAGADSVSPASAVSPSGVQDPVTLKHKEFSARFRRTGEYAAEWPAARLTHGVKTNLEPFAVTLVHPAERKSAGSVRAIPVLPADAAKPFESIEFTCNSTSLKLTLSVTPLSAIFWTPPLIVELFPDGSANAGEKQILRARLDLEAPFASGFYLRVRGDAAMPDIAATAICRPIRPGILRLETTPANASVQIDKKMFGYTPCVIRDLPVASTHVQFDAAPLLSGELDVQLANSGETRVTWQLPPRDDWRKTEFQMQSRVRQAAVDPIKSIQAAWHPRLGWMLAWSEDGDIHLATSMDGNTWTKPKRLGAPIRTIQSEDALALLIAPGSGRVALVFRRDNSLLVSSSDDLLQWSIPKVLSVGSNAQKKVEVGGAAVNALGHFILFVTESKQRDTSMAESGGVVCESFDGQTWSTPKPAPDLHLHDGYLTASADGQFELVEQAGTHAALLRRVTSDGLVWSESVESDATAERAKARWSNPAAAAVLILVARKNNVIPIPEEGADTLAGRQIKCSAFDVAWNRPAAGETARVMLATIQDGHVFAQLSRAPGDPPVLGARAEPAIQYESVAANDPAKPAAVVAVSANPVEKVNSNAAAPKPQASVAKPAAGGIGKWLPWAFGGLIVVLAAVLFVLQKRDAKPQMPDGEETP